MCIHYGRVCVARVASMKPETLAILASQAIVGGTSLTLSIPSTEKWPKGWPRGELMSVNDKGIKNYSN